MNGTSARRKESVPVQVNDSYRGTLSSYCYVLMCIHLLQQRQPAILPCLQSLKPATYQRYAVNAAPGLRADPCSCLSSLLPRVSASTISTPVIFLERHQWCC